MRNIPSRVLLADDEPCNLSLLQAILEPLELETCTAPNGREALARFREAAGGFDLVLLDVMMPELDGFRALAEMRRLTPDSDGVPIVLVSALTGRDHRMRGLEGGADDFLTKPLDPHDVRGRVRTLLALRRSRMELGRMREARAALLRGIQSPLTALLGCLSYGCSRAERAGDDLLRQNIERSNATVRTLLTAIDLLAAVEQLETGRPGVDRRPTRIRELLDSIAARHRAQLRGAGMIEVTGDVAITASIDVDMVERMIGYLLATVGCENGRTELAVTREGNTSVITLTSSCTVLPDEPHTGSFGTTKPVAESLGIGDPRGLGLYFSRLAAELHGGRVVVESEGNWATRLAIVFPGPTSSVASAFVD